MTDKKREFKLKTWHLVGIALAVIILPLTIAFVSNKNNTSNRSAQASTALRHGLGVSVFTDTPLSTLQAKLDRFQQIGVNAIWVTVPIEWLYSAGGTTPNSSNISSLDNIIDEAAKRGLPVQAQIHGTPSWINSSNIWHGPTSALSSNGKSERQNWVDCLSNLMSRTTPAGNKYADVITYAEIWNEPDSPDFWAPSVNVDNYARLVHDSAVVIRQVAPNVKIAAPNTSRSDTGFLGRFYDALNTLYGESEARANGYWFDVLGIHPYAGDDTGGFDPVTDPSSPQCLHTTSLGATNWCFLGYRLMHDLQLQREGQSKDMIFGEFGYRAASQGWFNVSEATRAQYLKSAYTLAAGDSYVKLMTWFSYDYTGDEFSAPFAIKGTSTETAFAESALATPTPSQTASTTVTNLGVSGSSPTSPTTVSYTLQTTGSQTVDQLVVAVRDANDQHVDFPVRTNVTLSGTQSFTDQRTFPAGTYTYWVAYLKNGVWTGLPPINNTFTISDSTASTTVTSLTVTGSSSTSPATANYTLQTTGSHTVDQLVVTVRDANDQIVDFPKRYNVTLSGTQSFSDQKTFPAGTYSYWVAYLKGGVWTGLPPTNNTFTISTPTPTPNQTASTTVTNLAVTGSSSTSPATANYTLQTTGSQTVDQLVVAVRNANGQNVDFPLRNNVTLSGTQSFTDQKTFTAGTYSYWIAYLKGGVWTSLPPTNTFTISNPTPTPIPTQVPTVAPTTPPTTTGNGLQGSYFTNKYLSGSPALIRIDPFVNFNWSTGSPASSIPSNNFSVRWTGYVVPKYSQTYTFYTMSDDGVRLWVNGVRIINNWTNHAAKQNSGSITLTAGKKYSIQMDYYENSGKAVAGLFWSSPSQAKQVIPQSQLFAQ